MSKIYVIAFDYNYFGTEKKEVAIELMDLKPLDKEYVKEENNYIYTPKKTETGLVVVDSSFVRSLTEDEKENKALASAESSLSYYKGVSETQKKEIEELKCQIKMLSKQEE